MKFVSTLLASGAACAVLMGAAEAKQRPVWEIGAGAFGTYSPDYYGSDESGFGGFPVIYFSYRGDDFSILSNGLFDVDADNENTFDFGISIDGGGKIKSKDRRLLGDFRADKIDYVGEIGPEITIGLWHDGISRFEVGAAARAAFEWNEGYFGFVVQPRVAFKTSISSTFRVGIYAAPKFGFDGYNERYYSTPDYVLNGVPIAAFEADDGYIGTDIGLNFVNDINDRFRISGEFKAISLGGAENEDSVLYRENWNYAVRLGFTYSLWQSDEMTDN